MSAGDTEQPPAVPDDGVYVKLNYIDKLFVTAQRVEDSTARFHRLQVVVSLLLLGLTTGLVSTDESLEISGIELELPLWTVIGGGAVGTGIATGLALLSDGHASRLYQAIGRLYSERRPVRPARDAIAPQAAGS